MRGGLTWRFSAGFAVAFALTPCVAFAQQAGAPSVLPGERVQEVDLTASVLYDSNVTATSASLGGTRGLQKSDEVFDPGIHFEVARPIGRETVYIQGDAGYDFHVHDTRLNRENLDFRPGVLGQIGPCQTGVSGEYSRAQSSLAELALTPAGLPVAVDQQNVLQVEEIGGNASCVRPTGFGPSVEASETWTGNSSKVQRYVDAQTFSGSAGLSYQRPVLGSVRFFGAFSQTGYPHRSGLIGVPGAGVATGYQTLSGGVSYTRAVGSRLQGSLSVSYTKLTEQGSALAGFSGATYSAALSYMASSRLQVSTAVSRATVPSNRLNSTFGIDNIYSGQVSYQLGPRLTIDSGVSFDHNTYNGVPFSLGGFDLTDEKILAVFGDVSFRLNRRLSLALDIHQLQRDANLPGASYPETRVGLTARATF